MKQLTKKQQKQIQYFIREKIERKHKQQMLHDSELPKFIEKRLPYVRRLARNLDQLLIVASFVSPPLKTGLIDRFLVLTELEGIEPIICLNKNDLLRNKSEAKHTVNMYRRIGYETIVTSALTSYGVSKLYERIKNKRSALAGHSGVGKSSLLNAMAPDLQIAVSEVSGATQKGKHTTSQVKIYKLNDQTEVIDLPGIKIVDFIDIHRTEARFYYREFAEFAESCKFSDCLHISENNCAVKHAVEEGHIHALRYKSYLNFVQSLE
jgi:ribosome biogenesis GTPase